MTAAISHNRKYLMSGALIAVVAIGAYGLGRVYPPLGPSEGTIAPAERYVSSQVGEGDVTLGDTSVPQLMQTDAFEMMTKDPNFLALARDANFAALARNPQALASMAANARDFAALGQESASVRAALKAAQARRRPAAPPMPATRRRRSRMARNAQAFEALAAIRRRSRRWLATPQAFDAYAKNAQAFSADARNPAGVAAMARNAQAFEALAKDAAAMDALARNRAGIRGPGAQCQCVRRPWPATRRRSPPRRAKPRPSRRNCAMPMRSTPRRRGLAPSIRRPSAQLATAAADVPARWPAMPHVVRGARRPSAGAWRPWPAMPRPSAPMPRTRRPSRRRCPQPGGRGAHGARMRRRSRRSPRDAQAMGALAAQRQCVRRAGAQCQRLCAFAANAQVLPGGDERAGARRHGRATPMRSRRWRAMPMAWPQRRARRRRSRLRRRRRKWRRNGRLNAQMMAAMAAQSAGVRGDGARTRRRSRRWPSNPQALASFAGQCQVVRGARPESELPGAGDEPGVRGRAAVAGVRGSFAAQRQRGRPLNEGRLAEGGR